MRRTVRMVMSVFLLGALSVGPAGAGGEPTRVVFAGSGTGVALATAMAQDFMKKHPEIRVEVPASIGTGGGIKAAAEGAIAVGMVTRSLKPEEKALGLTYLPIARVAQVFAVHPSVPDDGVTFADLVDIYRGRKTRWKNGQKVVVLTRELGDSSLLILYDKIPGFREAHEESVAKQYWHMLFSDQNMNKTLVATRNAIGISDLGEVAAERLAIKPLKLNGVVPSPESVRNGTYPLVKHIGFVYRSGSLPPAAKAFIDFIKSREGARLLLSYNFLPE